MIVRPALLGEEIDIAKLAIQYKDLVNPYVLDPDRVRCYLDEWLIAEEEVTGYILGAVHYVTLSRSNPEKYARNMDYLRVVKQVPDTLIDRMDPQGILLSQPTCPGKGSYRAIVEYLKDRYSPLYAYISITREAIIRFYERRGIKFEPTEYRFMNTYKGDYSTFKFGMWSRDE